MSARPFHTPDDELVQAVMAAYVRRTKPRNPKAYQESLDVRAAVRTILESRSPLEPPHTAKTVNALLPEHLRRSERRIQSHIAEIYSRHIDSG